MAGLVVLSKETVKVLPGHSDWQVAVYFETWPNLINNLESTAFSPGHVLSDYKTLTNLTTKYMSGERLTLMGRFLIL